MDHQLQTQQQAMELYYLYKLQNGLEILTDFLFLFYPSLYGESFGRRLLGWISATGSAQHDQEATLHNLLQRRLSGTQEMEVLH